MIEAPVARIYVGAPVFTGEVLALYLIESICNLVIGNIPGIHPNILGDFGKTADDDIQQEEVG